MAEIPFGELKSGEMFFDSSRQDERIVFVKEGYGGKAFSLDNPDFFTYFNEADDVERVTDG